MVVCCWLCVCLLSLPGCVMWVLCWRNFVGNLRVFEWDSLVLLLLGRIGVVTSVPGLVLVVWLAGSSVPKWGVRFSCRFVWYLGAASIAGVPVVFPLVLVGLGTVGRLLIC